MLDLYTENSESYTATLRSSARSLCAAPTSSFANIAFVPMIREVSSVYSIIPSRADKDAGRFLDDLVLSVDVTQYSSSRLTLVRRDKGPQYSHMSRCSLVFARREGHTS